jgi:hypothetical protein
MQSKQMAMIALSPIVAIDYLGDGTILTRVMFCSVVVGKKNIDVFFCQKNRRWLLGGGELIMLQSTPAAHGLEELFSLS